MEDLDDPVSFLRVALYAAERRNFHICVSCVVKASLLNMKTHPDPFLLIVDEIVNVCTRLNSRVRCESDNRLQKELFVCGLCSLILIDPITVACGHTFCQNCVYLNQHCSCPFCGDNCLNRRYQPNTIINKCIQLSHPFEKEKRRVKSDGNKFMNEKNFHKAIQLYSEGLKLDDRDHFLLGNRAKAFLCIGDSNASLEDSNLAIKVKPYWTKGFYRKAVALWEQKNYDDAAANYFICLCINPSIPEAKDGLLLYLRLIFGTRKEEFLSQFCSYADHYTKLFYEDRLSFLSKMRSIDFSAWVKTVNKSELEVSNVKRAGQKRRASAKDLPINDTAKRVKMDIGDDSSVDYKSIISYEKNLDYEKIFTMEDFECCLCFRLLYYPVTTPCGHSFCRQCLDRCLDYTPECPLCKQSLVKYLEERRDGESEIMVRVMNRCWSDEVVKRKKVYEEEVSKLARAGTDLQHEMPIFVCTLAFPQVPCQLHIFEPRYRLMIRRCMEVRSPKFGMTVGGSQQFVDVGTILEIRNVEYLPDGRSLVDTVGGRRFRVHQRGMLDGYNTAKIELIDDEALTPEKREALTPVCQQFYSRLSAWYNSLDSQLIDQFSANYGPLPSISLETLSSKDGPSWLWWLIAVIPLDISRRLDLIASTDFEHRLTTMMNVFSHLISPSMRL